MADTESGNRICPTCGRSNENSIQKLRMLSVRAYNALIRNNILTIEELRRTTENELYEMRNIGFLTVQNIEDALAYWDKYDNPEPKR